MLLFPNALFAKGGAVGGQASGPVFDLDFAGATYSDSDQSYPSLSAMPGYAFTRTGEQVAHSGSTATAFAANTPAIMSNGFHTYGALTNFVARNQEIDHTDWTNLSGGTGSAPIITANHATAPNGTTTAERVQMNRGAGTASGDYSLRYRVSTITNSGNHTRGVWLKSNTGSNQTVLLYLAQGPTTYARTVTVTADWKWFPQVENLAGSGNTSWVFGTRGGSFGGQQTLDILIWLPGLVEGNLVTSPGIKTAASTASIGASALAVNCPDGSYTATYTFDDDSTQVISTTISGGTFNHPTEGVLNRGVVKRVTLTAV